MEKVHLETGAIIGATGGFLLSEYQKVMGRYSFLDVILMDYCSDEILKYLDGRREELCDLCIRKEGQIIKFPSSIRKRFEVPVPKHDLFPLKKYRLPHGKAKLFSSVMTSYGCPSKCSFCISENLHYKYRSVENVLAEIDLLHSLGVEEIFFKDFTFGLPKKEAKELCQQIKNRYPNLSWICASRVDVLDEEMLKLMKSAGCHTIQFGVESASQNLLDGCQKSVTVKQIQHTFQVCKNLGIRTLGHFILGMPGETAESIQQTLALAKSIQCDYASFNVYVPLHGTSMRKYCIENNWLIETEESYDLSSGYPVIETPYLSREKLWELRNQTIRKFYLRPSFILKKLFAIRSFKEFKRLVIEGVSLVLSTIKTDKNS